MTCIAPLPSNVVFNKETVVLDVATKVNELSATVKSDQNLMIYMKDTIEQMFDEYQVDSEQRGKLISEAVSQFTITANNQVMQMAVQWAMSENEQAYTLAKLKNEALITEMNLYKAYAESCLVASQVKLTEAQADKTVADMIREDGRVLTRDADGNITALQDEGVKFAQQEELIAKKYNILAETFRKNGVVRLGVDINDNVEKGISGDADGNNYAAKLVTLRQEKGFDDNMRQHAANSASQMISFMLSGDAGSHIQAEDVTRWRNAVDYLLT